jgi:hypothetical protein
MGRITVVDRIIRFESGREPQNSLKFPRILRTRLFDFDP